MDEGAEVLLPLQRRRVEREVARLCPGRAADHYVRRCDVDVGLVAAGVTLAPLQVT